jgi:hypothetical protein
MAAKLAKQSHFSQIAGWLAAYALILHAFLAAIIPPVTVQSTDELAGFIICAHDANSVPSPVQAPGSADHCEGHCTLARAFDGLCAAVPVLASVIIINLETASRSWAVADDPLPDTTKVIQKGPRGPPQLV